MHFWWRKWALIKKKYLGLNLRIMYLNSIHSELRGFKKLINLSDVYVSSCINETGQICVLQKNLDSLVSIWFDLNNHFLNAFIQIV